MIKTRTVISLETKYEIIIIHQDGVTVTTVIQLLELGEANKYTIKTLNF
jgi:hypothetical protein